MSLPQSYRDDCECSSCRYERANNPEYRSMIATKEAKTMFIEAMTKQMGILADIFQHKDAEILSLRHQLIVANNKIQELESKLAEKGKS